MTNESAEVRAEIARLSRTLNTWMIEQGSDTLVTAESITGGGVAAALTAVPGTSAYFLGGVVAYSNPAKHQLLGVPEATLANPGAVSARCAEAMATGARDLFDATFAVATTGLAGPGGETGREPVGLVYVAVAVPDGVKVEEHRFHGDRESITDDAIHAALRLLHGEIRAWLDRVASR